MRRLIITIDVEAFPARQTSQHVERLIWGRFGDRQSGILEMMDIAERFGHRLTFFVDFCERFLHLGAIEPVARTIVQRGHDLQLHAHPEFLTESFWAKRGLPEWKTSLSGYTAERAQALLEFLIESARDAGANPVAFRGGAFRFNHEVLEAMARCGIPLSFNYNVKTAHQPNNHQNRSLFRWSNGIVEVPAGYGELRGASRPFDINQMNLADSEGVHTYLDGHFRSFGEDAALVLVMHSWSFCEKNQETGHFELTGDALKNSFENFLSDLPSEYSIRTASELATDLASGAIAVAEIRDIGLVDRDRYPPPEVGRQQSQRPTAQTSSVDGALEPTRRSACNYCGTPADAMEDFGGRKKVRCPGCRSLERNRVLLWTYERFIQPEFDMAEKRVLLVAPADAEDAYFRQRSRVTSCDVRPVNGFDRQLDICRMPEVADESFDAVVAIAVLQHCYDDEAALDEIRRVLTPGGRVLLHVSVRANAPTEQIENVAQHYGQEALESFRVGTYRYYGDLPLLRLLQKRFLIKTFYGFDPVTLGTSVIFCGIKDPAA